MQVVRPGGSFDWVAPWSGRWFPNGIDEQTVVQMDSGHPDGFTFDADGNIIICAIDLGGEPDAIQTWSVTGEKLDQFVPGDNPKYTTIALDGEGRMVIADSEAGSCSRSSGRPGGCRSTRSADREEARRRVSDRVPAGPG